MSGSPRRLLALVSNLPPGSATFRRDAVTWEQEIAAQTLEAVHGVRLQVAGTIPGAKLGRPPQVQRPNERPGEQEPARSRPANVTSIAEFAARTQRLDEEFGENHVA